MSVLIVLALMALLAGAALAPVAARFGRVRASQTAAAALIGALALLAPLAPGVLSGQVVVASWSWLPEWGLDLAFRFDGLSLLFALLILGIGLLIVLYASYYLPVADRMGRFLGLLLVFAAGMLGIVLSENILLLLVFWEITSVTSFLLIAYKYEAHDGRIAARMALAVTGGGGLAMLAGFLLLGHIAGSFELSDILARGAQIRAHPLYAPTLVLILLGAFTKSAQFPLHFWLPNAMAAPTPVSAYLHSATMVKAGVFLLARLHPALAGTELWFGLVSSVGAATFVYGAYVALLKHDFKGLLAYSTVSHLGLITLLFGLDTPLSVVAGVFHIINHAVFKASLFMAAGIIDHECGTRDMRRINGLFKYMPYTATLGIVAAGAMAGVPLLNGFLSKEMFFAEAIEHPHFGAHTWVLPVFATIAGTLSVAYSTRFIHDVFFNGEPINLPRSPHEPPRWMRFPVEILVLLCIAVGVAPQLSVGPLLDAAAGAALLGNLPAFKLSVWHGFNLPLVMSFVALAAGIVYYLNRRFLFELHERYLPDLQSPVAFERVYQAMTAAAARVMALVDSGAPRRYLAPLLVFAIALGLWAYWSAHPDGLALAGGAAGAPAGPLVQALALAGLAALAAGCLGVVACHRQRLLAIIFMSVVGLVVSMTFVLLSAPDLALTQISVEVVTIVVMLLALRFLPARAETAEPRGRRLRDMAIAGLAGGGVAALSYAMLTRPFETISNFYLANAVPGGGGANAVNVILVDFRGFDTLGEITVLAMAALGAHALVSGLRLAPYAGSAEREADRHPIMLAMLVRPLLPLALAVSLYILLRGHNLPGGGFIAGLVTSVALILQYIACGIDFGRARLPLDQPRLIAAGLAIAGATGLASWLFGAPFLTSAHGHVHLPLIGDVELASAMLFDLGVYLVVVGGTLLVLTELGALSRRELAAEGATREAATREPATQEPAPWN
ncbi:monovalent cation/H+ antiporter subunit A [Blastochloris tepida]|uniref:Monovalent cation/H+ antiporter subunit A n=1 Tax=Blastochloris tepida TaxID=2233851 RepID=A0A348FW76_9HYPH|nr:monovalent cation/H+ antiporter subunit A [Blastochloris tepida]